jgi:hypothetical protein
MKNMHFELPEPKGYDQAHGLAYRLVLDELAGIEDIGQQCRKSGAQCQVLDSRKTVVIRYLDQPYRISLPDGEISTMNNADELTLRDKLIILHYFTSAKGTPPEGRLVTFRELPEGKVYSPTFSKRTIQPLLENFGKDPGSLPSVGQRLGGYKADYGDTAVTINALNRVPITIVIWQGDEEFASQGNILFDANITDYLPTEDITVLCEIITWKLIRFLKEGL